MARWRFKIHQDGWDWRRPKGGGGGGGGWSRCSSRVYTTHITYIYLKLLYRRVPFLRCVSPISLSLTGMHFGNLPSYCHEDKASWLAPPFQLARESVVHYLVYTTTSNPYTFDGITHPWSFSLACISSPPNKLLSFLFFLFLTSCCLVSVCVRPFVH